MTEPIIIQDLLQITRYINRAKRDAKGDSFSLNLPINNWVKVKDSLFESIDEIRERIYDTPKWREWFYSTTENYCSNCQETKEEVFWKREGQSHGYCAQCTLEILTARKESEGKKR